MIFEKHLIISDPTLSLVQTLKNEVDLSSTQIKQAVQKGCLWLQKGHKTKRLRRLKTKLEMGQQLHLYYNQKILEQQPLIAELIEDNTAYSVWHKPAGMLCQGSKWGDHTTIYRYAEKHLQPERQAIILHRLDKMTSGLIILAHHRKMAAAFTHLFEQRKMNKCYRTIVKGNIQQLFESNDEMIINTPLEGKSAISRVRLIESDSNLNQCLLDVSIETGRKHQIRKHLAGISHPVIGDRLYGDEANDHSEIPNLQLVAYRLEFKCPITDGLKQFQLDPTKLPTFS